MSYMYDGDPKRKRKKKLLRKVSRHREVKAHGYALYGVADGKRRLVMSRVLGVMMSIQALYAVNLFC